MNHALKNGALTVSIGLIAIGVRYDGPWAWAAVIIGSILIGLTQ